MTCFVFLIVSLSLTFDRPMLPDELPMLREMGVAVNTVNLYFDFERSG